MLIICNLKYELLNIPVMLFRSTRAQRIRGATNNLRIKVFCYFLLKNQPSPQVFLWLFCGIVFKAVLITKFKWKTTPFTPLKLLLTSILQTLK